MNLRGIFETITNLAQYGIGYLDASETPYIPEYKFNLCDDNGFVVAKEKTPEMPPKYADGTFRTKSNHGLLEYRFFHNGKQHSVTGYSKTECYDKRTAFITEEAVKQKNAIITLKDWAIKWLKLYKEPKIKFNYYKAICSYLDNYIYPTFGNRPITKIKSLEIQEFLTEIKSDCTRTKIAAVLSDLFRRAYANDLIIKNPYTGVDFNRYQQPTLGALTHKQQLLLLDSIKDEELKDITTILLCTGLRQGELLALMPDDIDMEAQTIRISKTRDRYLQHNTSPKTKASYREVPFAKMLKAIFTKNIHKKERLFNYNPDFITKFFIKTFNNLNMPFSGHILRHTFITNAYELQIPEYIVQKWVGHAKRKQADAYLGTRKKSEFIDTYIVRYMRELKELTIL